jgi:hypothetical protein
MKNIIGLFLILFLSACSKYQEVEILNVNAEKIKPQKVTLFVDCSVSMKGFFNKTDASNILSNIGSDINRDGIEVEFHKFNAQSDSIASNIEAFTSSLNGDFFNCEQNMFSAPFKSIASKISDNDIAIILTDAVISTSGTSRTISDESASLKNIIADDQRERNNVFGLFHYLFDYNGNYYAQPSDKHFATGDIQRNFYIFSFGNNRFNSYLNEVIIRRNKPDNYQYFTNAYDDFIKIETIENFTFVAGDKFSLSMIIDEDATGLKLEDLQRYLQITRDTTALDKAAVKVTTTSTPNTYKVDVDLSQVKDLKIEGKYTLRLNQKTKVKDEILALNYNVAEEPKNNEEIDHAKTYSLDEGVLKALAYCYQDSYLFESELSIKPAEKTNVFSGLYTIILGKQANSEWLDVYTKIFFIWIFAPFLFSVFFYRSKIFDGKSAEEATGTWLLTLIINAAVVTLLTFTIAYTITDNFLPALYHGLFNAFLSILVYFGVSILLKQTNSNLQYTPF